MTGGQLELRTSSVLARVQVLNSPRECESPIGSIDRAFASGSTDSQVLCSSLGVFPVSATLASSSSLASASVCRFRSATRTPNNEGRNRDERKRQGQQLLIGRGLPTWPPREEEAKVFEVSLPEDRKQVCIKCSVGHQQNDEGDVPSNEVDEENLSNPNERCSKRGHASAPMVFRTRLYMRLAYAPPSRP